MRLEAFSARIDLADKRPKTKQSASPTLDFPEPLGPRIQLYFPSRGTSVLWAKLLKPWMAILLIIVIIKILFSERMFHFGFIKVSKMETSKDQSLLKVLGWQKLFKGNLINKLNFRKIWT